MKTPGAALEDRVEYRTAAMRKNGRAFIWPDPSISSGISVIPCNSGLTVLTASGHCEGPLRGADFSAHEACSVLSAADRSVCARCELARPADPSRRPRYVGDHHR